MKLYDYSVEFHKLIERKSPGSDEQSKKALSYLPHLGSDAKIIDIGCANGMQTVMLAQNTGAHITAIDIVPDFLDELRRKIKRFGLEDRVTVRLQSMDNLGYHAETFDLLWSENSICHIGFTRGVNEWKLYLKPGGHIVVTDLAWLTDEQCPRELADFICKITCDIGTVKNRIEILHKSGYEIIKFFVLPDYCWLEEYYFLLGSQVKSFLRRHAMHRFAVMYTNEILHELEMYKKYKEFYGMVFFVAKLKKGF